MKNALNWFEIPVDNMARARRFYGTLFDTDLAIEPMCGGEMSLLPYERPAIGGCLFRHEALTPSPQGTLVYLNAGDDLAPMLARVEAAGGRVTLPKTLINEAVGYMALFIDSEGNRVGLHSPR